LRGRPLCKYCTLQFVGRHPSRDRTRIAPDECGGIGKMTRKIQVHQVDAFTRERFTGNPAGVVLNADGLTEAQMLAIARELNNADTAFILSPERQDHNLRAPFFTPRTEARFGGDATVAAHYVLSRRHEAQRHLRQKSKAGTVDIEVRGTNEDRSIAIRQ